MFLVKPKVDILKAPSIDDLLLIEKAARICWKSEGRMVPGVVNYDFINKIIKIGHESVIEHGVASVLLTIDRNVTHELVRHRIASYSQESTRYVDYSKGVTYVIPPWINIEPGEYHFDSTNLAYLNHNSQTFILELLENEKTYIKARKQGWSPQEAAGFLAHFVKAEIVVTFNFREWRHVLKSRTAKDANPKIQQIMLMILKEFKQLIPVIFDNVGEKF